MRDYWSTSDPAEIERLLNAFKYGGTNKPLETFNFTNWNHASDDKLTYNDETKILYGSYATCQNGSCDVVGFSIKAHSGDESAFSILTESGKWYERSSGAIKQTNVEFGIIAGGTKAGVSLLKWMWNNVINPQSPTTVNTFDANAGKFLKTAAGKDYKKLNDSYLKNSGIDAHELKKEFLGNRVQISRYDLYRNSQSGEILILGKGGLGTPIQTGRFIKL